MTNSTIAIFLIISFFIIYSPIYLQRRKIDRMVDEDLKKIDYDEWKKQIKSNAYIKFFTRVIWGLFILSSFIFNFQKVVEVGFSWLTVFVFVLGISFIIWGILGFRSELRKLNEIK